nr:endonuclease/exonuclease/phosphatase family protein [Planosporangium flavigriseum]
MLSPTATERIAPTADSALHIAGWLAVGGTAAWALIRVFGLDRVGGPLVQLIAFTPYAAAGAVILLGPALTLRAWWTAGVAAVAAVALLVCVLPRSLPDGGVAEGARLRLLSSNMMIGGADAGAIVDLVRRRDVQVLALQEFTPQAERALDAAGVADLLPYRVSHPQPGAGGSAVFSRFPLRDEVPHTLPSGFTQAMATILVPDAATVTVESAHPCAPISPSLASCWRTDLSHEPRASTDGVVRVLAGDFNATLDHADLRRLIASGYRDAADVRGQGLTASWPYDEKWWIPGVTIDHVLADRRVGVAGYGVHRVPRTDHRAVFAELVVPR